MILEKVFLAEVSHGETACNSKESLKLYFKLAGP